MSPATTAEPSSTRLWSGKMLNGDKGAGWPYERVLKARLWCADFPDLSCFVANKLPWYADTIAEQSTFVQSTGWDMPWYQVPIIRHTWGEVQKVQHPGTQELFLDLIFVGLAYRIGDVLAASYYDCDPGSSGLSSGSSSSSGGGSGDDADHDDSIGRVL